jgi:RimJ/RimL family protein N-acetyltransferase
MKGKEIKGCVHPEDSWTNYGCGDCGEYVTYCGCRGPRGNGEKEMIEEMAKEICNVCYERQGTNTRWCEAYGRKDCTAFDSAEIFYNAGYRKIPEVVYENKRIYLNNKLIGYIDFSFYEDIKALGIGDFEIIDKLKGYGSFVVKDIIAKYKNEYDLIYCFVDKDNIGAIEFYKKVGKVCFDKINAQNQYYVILYDNEVKKARKETAKEIINEFALSPRTRAMIVEKYGLTKEDFGE